MPSLSISLKAVNQLLCGEKKYLSIVDQTCFKTGTAREVKEHFQRTLVGTGWTMDDRGTKWCIEHAIARCWYDHSDPEDVLRCWSHENMYAGDKDATFQVCTRGRGANGAPGVSPGHSGAGPGQASVIIASASGAQAWWAARA